jgi:putative DNA-invertase from lambdoid prophage Rac
MSESKATLTPTRRKLPRSTVQTNPLLPQAPSQNRSQSESCVRVAIYARVSTTDQQCEMQLRDLRQYAAARGWTLAGEYVDTGWSGKNSQRPELQRCIADAKARNFDAIVVWKLDRWGRTVQQLVNDILDFDSAGIRFIAITQGIDTDSSNPISRLLLHIMAAFAEFERSVINERVVAGIRNAQAEGTRSGRPIGRPKRVFNREQVLEMREAGLSLAKISAATGLPKTTIRRVR